MRNVTKMFMTLLMLCLAGASYAGENIIASVDYTTNPVTVNGTPYSSAGYPFYRISNLAGTAYEVEDGALTIVNTSDEGYSMDLSLIIADQFSVHEGCDYIVKIEYMSNAAGPVNVVISNWNNYVVKDEVAITASGSYQTLELKFMKPKFSSEGNNHVLWQCRKVVGTMKIRKVEVIEISPDKPIVWTNIIVNSELSGSDMSCFYQKVYPETEISQSSATDGVIVINSPARVENEWDTQFFVVLPQTLPAGTPFKVSFRCKASAPATVGTQSHSGPGQYIYWACLDDIPVSTEWKTFETTAYVSEYCDGSDGGGYKKDFRTICFKLSQDKDITYYFDNIAVAVDEDIALNPQPFPAGDEITNVIYVQDAEFPVKEVTQTVELSICMKNTAPIRGFEFDMYLPEVISVKKNNKGRIQGVRFNAGRLPEDDEHTLTLSELSDGAVHFVCGSMYDETFTGNDGEIMIMEVNLLANVAVGDYPIQLKNIKLTETNPSNYYETELMESVFRVTGEPSLPNVVPDGTYYMVNAYTGMLVAAGGLNKEGAPLTFAFDANAGYTITGSDLFAGKTWVVENALEGMSGYYVLYTLVDGVKKYAAVNEYGYFTLTEDGTADAAVWSLLDSEYWESSLSYHVFGTADLCGTALDRNANEMTRNTETGLYEWTAENITVSNDVKPEFKIAVNSTDDWGDVETIAEYPVEDNWFVITPAVTGGEGVFNITITFNNKTKEIGVIAENAEYELYVFNRRVTSENKDDILGDGTFSYNPKSKTLTIHKSFTKIDSGELVNNYTVEGLVVSIPNDVTLDVFQGILSHKDITITGPGHLTLTSRGTVITDIMDASTLTIKDITIDAECPEYYGIAGEYHESLVIQNATIHSKAPYGAICDFDSGITLLGCKIETPDGGMVLNGDIVDANGALATEVSIVREFIKGDVNADSKIDIADAVTVLNVMAGSPAAGNADVNADNKVDIADFVTVLNIMAGQ